VAGKGCRFLPRRNGQASPSAFWTLGVCIRPASSCSPKAGFVFALASTLLIATNYVTVKYAQGPGGFDSVTFSAVWATAAALYSALGALVSGGRSPFRVPRGHRSVVGIIGLVTGAGMVVGWAGLRRLDPSFAGFLWRFAPVVTLVLGVVFLKDRVRRAEVFPIVVMVVGGCVSTLDGWRVVGVGVVLTLVSCVLSAIQLTLSKVATRTVRPSTLVFYRNALGAAGIWAWVALRGTASFPAGPAHWLAALGGAFVGPFLGMALMYHSYRHWDLSRTAIVQTLQPLFVLPLAVAFLGMRPEVGQFLGGLVIMAGAFWLAWIHRAPRDVGRPREGAGQTAGRAVS